VSFIFLYDFNLPVNISCRVLEIRNQQSRRKQRGCCLGKALTSFGTNKKRKEFALDKLQAPDSPPLDPCQQAPENRDVYTFGN
jgi:hypothetical protein